MENKICKNCKTSKIISNFSIHHVDKAGREYRQSDCYKCVQKYNKAYYIRKKTRIKNEAARYRKQNKSAIAIRVAIRIKENSDFVDEIKRRAPCTDCTVIAPPYCMDFDHRGHKTATISQMARTAYSLETLKKEILKCELVCCMCHRLRTFRRLSQF